MLYQVLSRNNDINGNPFRLVILYNDQGEIKTAHEARSSMPKIVGYYQNKVYTELPTFHLAPAQYNGLKKDLKRWGFEIQSSY
ncbi:MAG: hypothetical protein V3V92_02585 [Candidatus Hydrothermarchaeales archaeon]